MDKTGFAKLMERPGVLSPEEWEDLRRERERFPFSAPLQVLSLLADKAGGVALWQKQLLPVVELYMNDVERLHELLERPTSSVPPSPSLRLESEPPANLQRTLSPHGTARFRAGRCSAAGCSRGLRCFEGNQCLSGSFVQNGPQERYFVRIFGKFGWYAP